MARLAEAGFHVGDNEPYTGALEGDTLYQHGTLRGLPHVLIEIRQDLIASDDAAQEFALRLKPILDAALSDMHGADMHGADMHGADMGGADMHRQE
jgi:predicted N-formylglutamate amidohydrolase